MYSLKRIINKEKYSNNFFFNAFLLKGCLYLFSLISYHGLAIATALFVWLLLFLFVYCRSYVHFMSCPELFWFALTMLFVLSCIDSFVVIWSNWRRSEWKLKKLCRWQKSNRNMFPTGCGGSSKKDRWD